MPVKTPTLLHTSQAGVCIRDFFTRIRAEMHQKRALIKQKCRPDKTGTA